MNDKWDNNKSFKSTRWRRSPEEIVKNRSKGSKIEQKEFTMRNTMHEESEIDKSVA
jgi:hypothetical protein